MNTLTIYTQEELKKIQTIQLECLKHIAGICESEGIEYFLIGGSALGAVRHNGYIPWDDDIDIALPRKDYERFIKIVPNKLSTKYHLQSPYTERNCPYYYSKIRIDGTLFMEYCNRRLNIHQGVYIDIFPYDNVPDDDSLNKKHFDKCQKLIRKFTLRQIPDVSCKPRGFVAFARAIIRKVAHYFCRCTSYSRLLNSLDQEFTRYNNEETKAMACLCFPKRKMEYIFRSDLYPLKKHVFEDTMFYIPNNNDTYLKTHYGDYMRLPSPNMRYGHKPYKVAFEV